MHKNSDNLMSIVSKLVNNSALAGIYEIPTRAVNNNIHQFPI